MTASKIKRPNSLKMKLLANKIFKGRENIKMEALKLTCLHVGKDINMLAVYILTVEINGSVETSGLIHLPKC